MALLNTRYSLDCVTRRRAYEHQSPKHLAATDLFLSCTFTHKTICFGRHFLSSGCVAVKQAALTPLHGEQPHFTIILAHSRLALSRRVLLAVSLANGLSFELYTQYPCFHARSNFQACLKRELSTTTTVALRLSSPRASTSPCSRKSSFSFPAGSSGLSPSRPLATNT